MTKTKLNVAIVGAGPAGASLAIRLAGSGHEVNLIERERFPRHKLCGEFISPECLVHFAEMGVLTQMLDAGGERIRETRFSDQKGRGFAISSCLLDRRNSALSLTRASMDNILFERAKSVGVRVFEGTKVAGCVVTDETLRSVTVVDDHRRRGVIEADIFIDATGRNRALSKLVLRSSHSGPTSVAANKPLAVGFKNHCRGVRIDPGVCEIFVFPGGYGGLSVVEDGLANLCFLMAPQAVRRLGSDPMKLIERAVRANARMADALTDAEPSGDWLAVSINAFGRAPRSTIRNMFMVGDSAAFIDPFTGSGMLMAFEGSALLATAIAGQAPSIQGIDSEYNQLRERTFARRLRICSILRQAAFVPGLPSAVIRILALSNAGQSYLARATRSPKGAV